MKLSKTVLPYRSVSEIDNLQWDLLCQNAKARDLVTKINNRFDKKAISDFFFNYLVPRNLEWVWWEYFYPILTQPAMWQHLGRPTMDRNFLTNLVGCRKDWWNFLPGPKIHPFPLNTELDRLLAIWPDRPDSAEYDQTLPPACYGSFGYGPHAAVKVRIVGLNYYSMPARSTIPEWFYNYTWAEKAVYVNLISHCIVDPSESYEAISGTDRLWNPTAGIFDDGYRKTQEILEEGATTEAYPCILPYLEAGRYLMARIDLTQKRKSIEHGLGNLRKIFGNLQKAARRLELEFKENSDRHHDKQTGRFLNIGCDITQKFHVESSQIVETAKCFSKRRIRGLDVWSQMLEAFKLKQNNPHLTLREIGDILAPGQKGEPSAMARDYIARAEKLIENGIPNR